MNSKQRMLCALELGKLDRMPVSVHQWQPYHLEEYLGGISDLEAFERFGLDAQIQYFQSMGQFWLVEADSTKFNTKEWIDEATVISNDPDDRIVHHTIQTPAGELSYKTAGDRKTTWVTEYMIKHNVVTEGSKKLIRTTVHKLFETLGKEGGYICALADHFFETPPEKIQWFADAARECVY